MCRKCLFGNTVSYIWEFYNFFEECIQQKPGRSERIIFFPPKVLFVYVGIIIYLNHNIEVLLGDFHLNNGTSSVEFMDSTNGLQFYHLHRH